MQKRRRKRRRNRSKRSLGYTEDAAKGTQRTGTASSVLHFHVDYSPFDTLKFLTAAETSSLSLFTLLKSRQGGFAQCTFPRILGRQQQQQQQHNSLITSLANSSANEDEVSVFCGFLLLLLLVARPQLSVSHSLSQIDSC